MLPNFLIIGAMKAGTSSLYSYLRTHPQIFMSETKELSFFSRQWHLGQAWYESNFDGAGDARAVGEASPNYTKAHFWPETAERIASLLPDARLVYLLRDPLERIRSNYLHQLAMGHEDRPIGRALRDEDDPRTQDYIHTSRYAFQLQEYLAHFARGQILVLSSDRLLRERFDTTREVFRFLDVDDQWVPDNIDREKHQTARKRVRKRLVRRLRSLPGYRKAVGLVPLTIKRGFYRYATRPIDDSQLSRALRAHLLQRLQPDMEQLRMLVDLPEIENWGSL